MKKKRYPKNKLLMGVLFILCFCAVLNTRVVTNGLNILTDPVNYIPNKSSVFTFHPIQIDNGSGGYWRYGEDNRHYYYFSEKESNIYFYNPKENNCAAFDVFNYLTWCERAKDYHE